MNSSGFFIWNDSYPADFVYPVQGDLPVDRYRDVASGFSKYFEGKVENIEQENINRKYLEEVKEQLETAHSLDRVYDGENPLIENVLNAASENYFEKILQGRISEIDEENGIDFLQADILAAEGTRLAAEESASGADYAFHNGGGHHHGHRGQSSDPTFNRINDEASAIEYIKQEMENPEILVVDLDFHFGDGTVSIYRDDPNVHHFSMHQWDIFPHKKSGWLDYTGSGKAEGTIMNVLFTAGVGGETYLEILEKTLPEFAEHIDPDFVLYQSGVDTHHEDPLGEANLTNEDLFRRDQIIAELFDDKPLTVVTGGGYGSEAGRAEINTLAALEGEEIMLEDEGLTNEEKKDIESSKEKNLEWCNQLLEEHPAIS